LSVLLRSCFALLALVVLASGLLAAEYSAKVRRVDSSRLLLTVLIDGRERTYEVDPKARILDDAGKNLSGGLRSRRLRDGVSVRITTNKRRVVTRLRLGK
jgi:hypothetical protein